MIICIICLIFFKKSINATDKENMNKDKTCKSLTTHSLTTQLHQTFIYKIHFALSRNYCQTWQIKLGSFHKLVFFLNP